MFTYHCYNLGALMELSCTPNGKLDQTAATSTAYMYMYMVPRSAA